MSPREEWCSSCLGQRFYRLLGKRLSACPFCQGRGFVLFSKIKRGMKWRKSR
jgi:hypothetical protein